MQDNNKSSVPQKYFDNLSDKILNKIENLDDNTKEEAPTLFKVGKDLGYTVPKDYFETLEQKLKNNSSSAEVRKLIPQRWWNIAASLLILIISGTIVLLQKDDKTYSAEDLAFEEVLEYYIENSDFIDENALLDLETETEIVDADYLNEISDDELELYIEMNIEDFSDEEIDELF